MKRYELVNTQDEGVYRIRALVDMPILEVKSGELGGLVNGEKNLSQEGKGWIHYHSKVLGEAVVVDAVLYKRCVVTGNSRLEKGAYEESMIHDSVFYKTATVKESSIGGCIFKDSRVQIEEAELENVTCDTVVFTVIKSRWISEERTTIKNTYFIIKDSDIDCVDAFIDDRFKAIKFSGRIDVIHSSTNVDIQHVYCPVDMKRITFARPIRFHHTPLYRGEVVLHGAIGSRITITTSDEIRLYDVNIQGSVSIEGKDLSIITSRLKDYAHINMSGRLERVDLSDMSAISSENQYKHCIKDITLTGDTVMKTVDIVS